MSLGIKTNLTWSVWGPFKRLSLPPSCTQPAPRLPPQKSGCLFRGGMGWGAHRDNFAATWQIPSFVFLSLQESFHILSGLVAQLRTHSPSPPLSLDSHWLELFLVAKRGKKRGSRERGREKRGWGGGCPWRGQGSPKCPQNISFFSVSASGCRTRRAPRFS